MVTLSAIAAALAILAALLIWKRFRRGRSISPAEARQVFESQREELQRLFFAAAAASGKPRGLRWTGCDFHNGLELARDRRTGELLAFAAVTISFEAIPGSDMEGLPAVGNLRCATAVFILRKRRWSTLGRTLFNLEPGEALRHFARQYEAIEPTASADAPLAP